MTDPEPDFGELSRATVERSNEVVFLVDPGLRITYCNPAWDKFALANGGEQVVAARVIGTDLMRVIPESLRDLYSGLFQRCAQQHLTFDFDYECSSAEVYRLLHMNILPLNKAGALAFVNSIRIEHVHGPERPAVEAADVYVSPQGIVTLCSHCRRTRRREASDIWDWVPPFLNTTEWKVSHGVCPTCLSYFYSSFYSTSVNSGQHAEKPAESGLEKS